VQAAGRVIRNTLDQGEIFLMDDRFARPEIKRLLPAWWHVRQMRIRPENAADAASPRGAPADVAQP